MGGASEHHKGQRGWRCRSRGAVRVEVLLEVPGGGAQSGLRCYRSHPYTTRAGERMEVPEQGRRAGGGRGGAEGSWVLRNLNVIASSGPSCSHHYRPHRLYRYIVSFKGGRTEGG